MTKLHLFFSTFVALLHSSWALMSYSGWSRNTNNPHWNQRKISFLFWYKPTTNIFHHPKNLGCWWNTENLLNWCAAEVRTWLARREAGNRYGCSKTGHCFIINPSMYAVLWPAHARVLALGSTGPTKAQRAYPENFVTGRRTHTSSDIYIDFVQLWGTFPHVFWFLSREANLELILIVPHL